MRAPTNETEASIAKQLVERIIAGDSSAETEMVERYHRGLVAMLYNRSKDRNLAEGVAQDTWILVLQKVRNQELRDTSKLASFITQIGRNQLIMRYRASAKHQASDNDEIDDLADQQVLTPEQSLLNAQLGHTINALLDEMTQERDRDLIKRFYLSADDKATLCKEYNLTDAHFDRVLFRARQRFKLLWSERNG